jgi:hypothetical protein
LFDIKIANCFPFGKQEFVFRDFVNFSFLNVLCIFAFARMNNLISKLLNFICHPTFKFHSYDDNEDIQFIIIKKIFHSSPHHLPSSQMFCAYGAPPGKIKGRLQAMQDLRTK